MAAEFNLGSLSETPIVESHSVGNSDPIDTYSFSLASSGNINLSLTGISAGADADVRVFQDWDGNGMVDSGEREFGEVGRSARGSNLHESINLANQDAGAYVAEVYQYSGDTSYNLRLSTTPFRAPSNLLPVEREVGALTDTQTFTDAEDRSALGLGNDDTSDIYHFVVNTAGNFSFSLTDLTADVDIRLIQDTNGNRVVEPNSTFQSGEVLGVSQNSGTADDSISQFLNQGDYYVQVYQFGDVPSGSQGIGYSLTMTPVT